MAGAFSDPGHLPKLRSGRDPFDPYRLPRQRRGTTPQMHGRYPDFDVLAEARHWDEATRRAIFDRVEHVPPIRFFNKEEAAAIGAFLDCLLAQDGEPRVHPRPCPCCGGRMLIIESFASGCEPKYRPAPNMPPIRIDTS